MPSTINASNSGSGGLISTGDASGVLQLQTANGTTAITVDTSQNVGIGTSSPTAPLTVYAARYDTMRIGRSAAASFAVGIPSGSATDSLEFYGFQAGYDGYVFTGVSGEKMRITSAGNVGIGTTSPSQKLHVVSTTTAEGIRVSGSVDNVALNLSNSGTSGKTWGIYSANSGSGAGGGSLAFWDGTAYRMVLDTSGNFLVGGTSAIGKTSIYWDSSAQQGITTRTSSTTFNGSPIQFLNSSNVQSGAITQAANSVSYTSGSDYRLKENINPMTGALATVSALKPVTFQWKSDGSQGQGFIAHELQAVVPECVTGNKDALDKEGNPEYQGVDPSKLVATLTAAIQELKAINDTQAELISGQAKTINALTARIVALEGV